MKLLQKIIENAWGDRTFLKEENTIKSIIKVIDLLDEGTLRVAELKNTEWFVNEWIKKAVVLYFPIPKNGNFRSRNI